MNKRWTFHLIGNVVRMAGLLMAIPLQKPVGWLERRLRMRSLPRGSSSPSFLWKT